ncbi:MAG: hypothetical protein Q4D04_15110, partial [Clostridia bacterium]|nr:hypothetical protein [Clostridia bacterium]
MTNNIRADVVNVYGGNSADFVIRPDFSTFAKQTATGTAKKPSITRKFRRRCEDTAVMQRR